VGRTGSLLAVLARLPGVIVLEIPDVFWNAILQATFSSWTTQSRRCDLGGFCLDLTATKSPQVNFVKFIKTPIKTAALAVAVTGVLPAFLTACEHDACYQPAKTSNSIRYVVYVRKPIRSDSVQTSRPATPTVMAVDAGQSYRMTGEKYGIDIGSVVLAIGAAGIQSAEIECDVHSWSDQEITFQVPPLRLKQEVQGELRIVMPDGSVSVSKAIRLQGLRISVSKPVVEEPAVPTSAVSAPVKIEPVLESLSPPLISYDEPPILGAPLPPTGIQGAAGTEVQWGEEL